MSRVDDIRDGLAQVKITAEGEALYRDSGETSSVLFKHHDTSPKPIFPHEPQGDGSQFERVKSNSTSTVYMDSTISAPDHDLVLKSMATALMFHIRAGQETRGEKVYFEIFDEAKHPLTNGPVDFKHTPRERVVYRFLADVFKAENLPSEVAILGLSYVERLIIQTNVTINAYSWRRIVLSALILASKVWEDQAVWNVDFLSVFPQVDVQDLNILEKQLLNLIDFNVSLPASMYAKYYFELRALAEKTSRAFPLKPLSKEEQERLTVNSEQTEKLVKRKMQRTSSMERLTKFSEDAIKKK